MDGGKWLGMDGEVWGFQISQEMLGEFKYFFVSLSSCQPFQ